MRPASPRGTKASAVSATVSRASSSVARPRRSSSSSRLRGCTSRVTDWASISKLGRRADAPCRGSTRGWPRRSQKRGSVHQWANTSEAGERRGGAARGFALAQPLHQPCDLAAVQAGGGADAADAAVRQQPRMLRVGRLHQRQAQRLLQRRGAEAAGHRQPGQRPEQRLQRGRQLVGRQGVDFGRGRRARHPGMLPSVAAPAQSSHEMRLASTVTPSAASPPLSSMRRSLRARSACVRPRNTVPAVSCTVSPRSTKPWPS